VKALVLPKLDDPQMEQVVRNVGEAIRELQLLPVTAVRVVAGVELEDGVETAVAHGLSRAPVWVRESCVRGASTSGRVEEMRGATIDRKRVVVLKASGYGATVTCDVLVM
jgi:hypothetical protein